MASSFSASQHQQELAALRAEADAAVRRVKREKEKRDETKSGRDGRRSSETNRSLSLAFFPVSLEQGIHEFSLESTRSEFCFLLSRRRRCIRIHNGGRTRRLSVSSRIGFGEEKNALRALSPPPPKNTTTTPPTSTGPVGLGDEGGKRGPPRRDGLCDGEARRSSKAARLCRREVAGRGAGMARGGAGRRGAVPGGGREGATAGGRARKRGGGAEEGQGRGRRAGKGGGKGEDEEEGSRLCVCVCESLFFPCCRASSCCCPFSCCCSFGLAQYADSGANREVPVSGGPHAAHLFLVVVRERGCRRRRRERSRSGVSSRPPQAPLRRDWEKKSPPHSQDGAAGSGPGQARGLALGDEPRRRRRRRRRRSCCSPVAGGGGSGSRGGGGDRSFDSSSSEAAGAAAAAAGQVPRRVDLQDRGSPPSSSSGFFSEGCCSSCKAHGGGESGGAALRSCRPRRRGGGRSNRRRGGGGRGKGLDPQALLRRCRG